MKRVLFEKSSDRIGSFQALTEHFSKLSEKAQMPILPYRGAGPAYFAQLPEAMQAAVLDSFRPFVAICDAAVEEGWTLKQDGHLLWRMFQNLGVHPNSDLMALIDLGDIIEIYNTDFVQVFRNLQFFKYCGYTLDELLSRPFWQLFQRDEAVTNDIIAVARDLFGGVKTGIHWWQLGAHTIAEVDSPARYTSVIESKLVCPLHDNAGNVVALLNVNRCLSFSPGSEGHQ